MPWKDPDLLHLHSRKTGWWLNQSLLKNIYIVKLGSSSPKRGVNKTYFRNHHRSEKTLANFVGSLFWVQFLTHIIERSICWWWLSGVIFRQNKRGGDFNPLEKHESNCIIPLSKNKNKTYLKPPSVRKQLHRCAPLPSPINLLSTKFRSADPTLQSRRRATDPEQLRNSFLYLTFATIKGKSWVCNNQTGKLGTLGRAPRDIHQHIPPMD